MDLKNNLYIFDVISERRENSNPKRFLGKSFFNSKAKTKNFKCLNENTVMVTFTEFSLDTILARRNNVY